MGWCAAAQARAFVRASGTEDAVRVYAEAASQEAADQLALRVAQVGVAGRQLLCKSVLTWGCLMRLALALVHANACVNRQSLGCQS